VKTIAVVHMITSSGCERCAAVEARIVASSKRAGVGVNIVKFDSASDAAINLGVTYGLSDVPSFVVVNKSSPKGFSGTDFKDEDVVAALRMD